MALYLLMFYFDVRRNTLFWSNLGRSFAVHDLQVIWLICLQLWDRLKCRQCIIIHGPERRRHCYQIAIRFVRTQNCILSFPFSVDLIQLTSWCFIQCQLMCYIRTKMIWSTEILLGASLSSLIWVSEIWLNRFLDRIIYTNFLKQF